MLMVNGIMSKTKEANNPLIQLRKELEFAGLDSKEINNITERYKNTYSYAFYELGTAYYNFVRTIKKSLKKYQKYFKKKTMF